MIQTTLTPLPNAMRAIGLTDADAFFDGVKCANNRTETTGQKCYMLCPLFKVNVTPTPTRFPEKPSTKHK